MLFYKINKFINKVIAKHIETTIETSKYTIKSSKTIENYSPYNNSINLDNIITRKH
jgi:hypothetical protein